MKLVADGGYVDIRLLGPTEVLRDGVRLALGGPRQRAVLADLALHAGTTVLTSQLVDDIWGDSPPATADHTIEAYISRLRRVLHEPGQTNVLLTAGSGYVLAIDGMDVDVFRFGDLVERSRAGPQAGASSSGTEALLTSALQLWRGPALADLRDTEFGPLAATPLEEARLGVLEALIDVRLRAGRHRELVSELTTLIATEPYHERFHAQLMLALYRSGRQADALTAFQRVRNLFVRDLGIRPGRELRELEAAILAQAPELDLTPKLNQDVAGDSAVGSDAKVGSPAGASRPRPEPDETGIEALRPVAPAVAAVASEVTRPADTRVRRRRSVRTMVNRIVSIAATTVLVVLGLAGAAGPKHLMATVAATGITELSPSNGSVIRSLELPGDPQAAVAADGSLWVSSPEAHALYQVNPLSGRVVRTVGVGAGAGALTVVGSDIWVANLLAGTVSCVDGRTDRVIRTVHTGSEPSGLATRRGTVWVADALTSTVTAVDAANGRLGPSHDLSSTPFGVAAGAGSLWLTSPDTDDVTRLTVPGGPDVHISVGAGPTAAAFGFGSLWVTNSLDSTISRIDPDTDAVAATIPVGDGPDAVTVDAKSLWVANRISASLTRIDPDTDTVARSIPLRASPIALSATPGGLWTATETRDTGRPAGGTLRVVQSIPPTSIDPARTYPNLPFQFTEGSYDTLLTFERTGGGNGAQPIPDLALTMPTITDAGRVYTFVIRPGIRYSDGELLRPQDFRNAIERVEELNATAASFLIDIKGASACKTGEPCDLTAGITTSDSSNSITFHLTAPDPDLIDALTLPFTAPVPARIPDHDVGTNPVPSTGPYMIQRYIPGHQVDFTRNPDFVPWSAAAEPNGSPDAIVWTFGASISAETAEIRIGRADWTDDSIPDTAALLAAHPEQVHINPGGGTEYAKFNTRAAPFDRLAVRQAFSLAADRHALANQLGGPRVATPTCQILPPGLPGYRRYCPFTAHPAADGAWSGADLAAARKLVDASGTKGMHVTVWSHGGGDGRIGAFMVAVLRELGYRASMVIPSDPALAKEVNDSRNRAQATDGEWTADYPAASDFFDTFFRCSASRLDDPAATRSGAFFCNPSIDAEMNAADHEQTISPGRAASTWAAVDRAVTDQAPWVPLVTLSWTDFLSTRVTNYQFNPGFGLLLDQLDVDTGRQRPTH